jgi:hypothetical protein
MRTGFVVECCSHNLDFGFYQVVKFIGKTFIPSDGFSEAFNLLGNTFTEFEVGICNGTGQRTDSIS